MGWTSEQRSAFDDWIEFHGYNLRVSRIYQVAFPEGATGYFILTRYGDEGKSILEKVEMKSPPPNFV